MTKEDANHRGSEAGTSEDTTRVWDPLVWIFHWGLVVAFAVAWFSAEEMEAVQEVAGYVVAGLVAFRLVRGFVGSHYARFSQFLRAPSTILEYLGDMVRGRERRYVGHNPAGAVMIVAFIVALSGTAYTGWLLEESSRTAMLPEMPQVVDSAVADEHGEKREEAEYGAADSGEAESGEQVEELHETFANLTILLVAVHIAGVVLASFRHHENLTLAMITGNKRAPDPYDFD